MSCSSTYTLNRHRRHSLVWNSTRYRYSTDGASELTGMGCCKAVASVPLLKGPR